MRVAVVTWTQEITRNALPVASGNTDSLEKEILYIYHICMLHDIYNYTLITTIHYRLKYKWSSCFHRMYLTNEISEFLNHYTDVIMSAMASQSPASRVLTQTFVQAHTKENIKAQLHWPLWRESTGSHQKWPVTRKRFPFDYDIMYCESQRFECQLVSRACLYKYMGLFHIKKAQSPNHWGNSKQREMEKKLELP